MSVALATGLLLASSAVAADPVPVLGGVVRDVAGNALAGVEVLVLPDRSSDAVATALTGVDGRFRVTGIPGGLYRVAALKAGYLASVSRANTYVRSTVDVILRPAPRPGEPGADNVAASPSWVLRAPPRSILRETDLRDIANAPSSPSSAEKATRGIANALPARAPSLDLVAGQFRHLVALGSNGAVDGTRNGPIVGGDTSMELSGALGQRGSVRLAGRRETLAASRFETEGAPEGSRSAESLAFDISYDTSRDTSLDVSAYFAQGDVTVGALPEQPVDAGRETRRSWGYDATWTMQLDEASRLLVRLGYRDATLEVPEAYVPGLAGGLAGSLLNVTNRSIGATGSYEALAGDNHWVRVGARAQALDLAVPFVRDGGETMFVDLPGGAGWSIRIDAEDSWAVAAPWTVVYGLGVQQVLEGQDATLLVPRAGAIWSPGPLDVKLMISHVSVSSWGGADSDAAGDPLRAEWLDPMRPWGWEGEIAVPLGEGVTLRAAQSFQPVRDGARTIASAGALAEPIPLIVGTQASDLRNAVSLTRESGTTSTSLAWSWGRAEGRIGQAAGFRLPVQILIDRAIAYRSGRLGFRIPSSGTDVAVEYGRFEESEGWDADSLFVNSYVELAFGQQVAQFARLGATCRVLLGARFVPSESGGNGASPHLERSRMIAALNEQISAGLLVSF